MILSLTATRDFIKTFQLNWTSRFSLPVKLLSWRSLCKTPAPGDRRLLKGLVTGCGIFNLKGTGSNPESGLKRSISLLGRLPHNTFKIIEPRSGEPWETSSLQSEAHSWDKLEGCNSEMCKMLCQHKIKALVQLPEQCHELDSVVFRRRDV